MYFFLGGGKGIILAVSLRFFYPWRPRNNRFRPRKTVTHTQKNSVRNLHSIKGSES
jgi:hypothetical protein